MNFAGQMWQRCVWGSAGLFPRCERMRDMLPDLVSSTISPSTSTKRAGGLEETRPGGLDSDIMGRVARTCWTQRERMVMGRGKGCTVLDAHLNELQAAREGAARRLVRSPRRKSAHFQIGA